MVIAPTTLSVNAPMLIRAGLPPFPLIVNDAQLSFCVRVTVVLLTNVTLSEAPGTTPPTQDVVAFQLPPVAVLDILAALIDVIENSRIIIRDTMPLSLKSRFFFIISSLIR
jgi:hypothetical protein